MGPKKPSRTKKARSQEKREDETEAQGCNESKVLGEASEAQAGTSSKNEDEPQPGPSTAPSQRRPSRAAARKATENIKRPARRSSASSGPPVKMSRSRGKRSYSIGPILPPWPSRGILTGPVKVIKTPAPTSRISGDAKSQEETSPDGKMEHSSPEKAEGSGSPHKPGNEAVQGCAYGDPTQNEQGRNRSARRENRGSEFNFLGSDREEDGTHGQSSDLFASFPKGVRPAKITRRRNAVGRLSFEGCSSARTELGSDDSSWSLGVSDETDTTDPNASSVQFEECGSEESSDESDTSREV